MARGYAAYDPSTLQVGGVPRLRVSLVREGYVTDAPRITGPADVVSLIRAFIPQDDREHMICLFVNTKHRVTGAIEVSTGTLDSSIVHPREVFRPAVLAGAAGIIVAHNHPGGDPTPSPEDVRVTTRLKEAGAIVGIDLVDHIVIADGTPDLQCVSLRQRGVI